MTECVFLERPGCGYSSQTSSKAQRSLRVYERGHIWPGKHVADSVCSYLAGVQDGRTITITSGSGDTQLIASYC